MERKYLKDILDKKLGKNHKVLFRITGGMMNVSFLVEDGQGEKYIVYVPNGKSNKLVDRKVEKFNASVMQELNLTSEFIYFDTRSGIKIKRYIEGTVLTKIKDINYDKVAELLHKMHDSKILSPNDYHPFDRLANYENKAISFAREKDLYRHLKDFFAKHMYILDNVEKVLCHNDAQRSNILVDAEDNYWIIDFEFMANNDPVYDIACFANNNLKDGEELMKNYFIHPGKDEWQRFYLWRLFISLQWHVVAIIKHYQNEGNHTKFNFLKVADHFLDNALLAKTKFLQVK